MKKVFGFLVIFFVSLGISSCAPASSGSNYNIPGGTAASDVQWHDGIWADALFLEVDAKNALRVTATVFESNDSILLETQEIVTKNDANEVVSVEKPPSMLQKTQGYWMRTCGFSTSENNTYTGASGFTAVKTIREGEQSLMALACVTPISQLVQIERFETANYFFWTNYYLDIQVHGNAFQRIQRIQVTLPGKVRRTKPDLSAAIPATYELVDRNTVELLSLKDDAGQSPALAASETVLIAATSTKANATEIVYSLVVFLGTGFLGNVIYKVIENRAKKKKSANPDDDDPSPRREEETAGLKNTVTPKKFKG